MAYQHQMVILQRIAKNNLFLDVSLNYSQITKRGLLELKEIKHYLVNCFFLGNLNISMEFIGPKSIESSVHCT